MVTAEVSKYMLRIVLVGKLSTFTVYLFVVKVVSYIPKGLVNIICNRFQNRSSVASKSLLGNECLTSFITKHPSVGNI